MERTREMRDSVDMPPHPLAKGRVPVNIYAHRQESRGLRTDLDICGTQQLSLPHAGVSI